MAGEFVGEELSALLLTGLGMDQLFSRTTGEGGESYLTDRLGSTVALANGSKEITATYTYEPFGAPTVEGETDNPFAFTGRPDDGTGLQLNRARYYDPAAARFISEDPAGFAGSGSNVYNYIFGDPLDGVDPTGEQIHPGVWAAGAKQALEDAAGDLVGGVDDVLTSTPDVPANVAKWTYTNPGEAAGLIAAGICVVVTDGWCLLAVGAAATISVTDATVSSFCDGSLNRGLLGENLFNAGVSLVPGAPGVTKGGLVVTQRISSSNLPRSAAGRAALNAPGSAGSATGSIIGPRLGGQSGHSSATSSC